MTRKYYDTSLKYLLGQGMLFPIIFIMGIICGSVYAIRVRENSMLFFTINQYITIDYEINSRWEVMRDSIEVYGRNLVLVWMGGTFGLTLALSCIVFFIICFSYGFTTGCFLLIYGIKGIFISALAFGVQAAAIIFIGIYTGNKGVKYSIYKEVDTLKEYSKVLLIVGGAVLFTALIDAYVQPIMQHFIYMLL